jgi:hypothetical protein
VCAFAQGDRGDKRTLERGGYCKGAAVARTLTKYYGATLRDAEYPVANIFVKEGKNSLCGLLVLQSENSLILWNTAGRSGLVTAIPIDKVIALALGPPMDLKEVVSDAIDGKSTIDCKQIGDPSVTLGKK